MEREEFVKKFAEIALKKREDAIEVIKALKLASADMMADFVLSGYYTDAKKYALMFYVYDVLLNALYELSPMVRVEIKLAMLEKDYKMKPDYEEIYKAILKHLK